MELFHRKPCKECPWRLEAPQGYLGGHSPEFYADAVAENEIPEKRLENFYDDEDYDYQADEDYVAPTPPPPHHANDPVTDVTPSPDLQHDPNCWQVVFDKSSPLMGRAEAYDYKIGKWIPLPKHVYPCEILGGRLSSGMVFQLMAPKPLELTGWELYRLAFYREDHEGIARIFAWRIFERCQKEDTLHIKVD